MKLRIDNNKIGPCIAKGIDQKNDSFLVFGGDLFIGELVEVESYGKTNESFIVNQLNYESIEIFAKHFDKDGLIKLSELKRLSINQSHISGFMKLKVIGSSLKRKSLIN